MRNMKKLLVLLLAVVMLVSNLPITATATESWAPLDLETRPAAGGILQVDILATEGSIVAEGKLVLTYDPAVLTYEGTEISTAWNDANAVTLSINDNNGKLILAFASAEAAGEGVLFSVRFSGAVCDTQIGLVGRDSYIGSSKVPAIGGEYCPSDNFVDIRNSIPLIHDAVDYMVGMGYMNGMSQTMFGPNVELNRAMMVTILYRMNGSPGRECHIHFTDVPEGEFYTDAVAWAIAAGITNGVSEHLFAPNKTLTRQELVTFLYRYAHLCSQDMTPSADLSGYTDAAKVQPYAVEPFQWAVAKGIINGTSETTLSPENTTTRAQVCIMVARLLSSWE